MDQNDYSRILNMSPQLIVTSLDKALAFYTGLLGFAIDFRYGDFYVGIVKDGFSIHLKAGNPSAAERANKRREDGLDIVFAVHNPEALYRDFTAKAINIIQPLRDMPYGKEFYIEDPDRYILGFLNAG